MYDDILKGLRFLSNKTFEAAIFVPELVIIKLSIIGVSMFNTKFNKVCVWQGVEYLSNLHFKRQNGHMLFSMCEILNKVKSEEYIWEFIMYKILYYSPIPPCDYANINCL